MSKRVLLVFASRSFIVSSFILKSLINFEFVVVYGIREYLNFILLHVAQSFQHHLLKKLSFIHCIFLLLFHRLLDHKCVVLFLDSLSHSINPCVCFGTSTILFLCLQLFSIVSSQEQRRQWHPTPVLWPGKSHGRRSLVGCSPWDREELDMTERIHFHFSLLCIEEGNGSPLQCSCLENPRDGVAQSRTQLK